MQITLWTAEMFTAEETQIYIIPLDPPQAQWRVMSSKPPSTLYWDKGHNTHTRTTAIIVTTVTVVPDFQVLLWPFYILFKLMLHRAIVE